MEGKKKTQKNKQQKDRHLLSPGNKTVRLSLTQLEIHLLFKNF